MDAQTVALRYTEAWNSGDAAQPAACYAPGGSLSVNAGPPAVGREAIAAVVGGFMSAFPGLRLAFDGLTAHGGRIHYHWTFEGANTGPGGTGARVRFSGYEDWLLGPGGLITESRGHFDAEDFQRQLGRGEST